MSISTDVVQIVRPVFIYEADEYCLPIPRDSPNITKPFFQSIEARYKSSETSAPGFDESLNAQKMMKGEKNYGCFTHISIPFSLSSSIKGAYIVLHHLDYDDVPPHPSHLMFTFSTSKGKKTSKKYDFPEIETDCWFFLPVDLSDVVFCEITGKGKDQEYFHINSLVFFREETLEETVVREAREKQWLSCVQLKSEFVKEGDEDHIPFLLDDPKVLNPSLFSMVTAKDDTYSKESEEYDQTSDAQKMLKGEGYVYLSHLSIPFPSPSPIKGAYMCVIKYYSSPSLLFTFTDASGKKTSKKFEFSEPKFLNEWHFLPIDLDNVVLCEIEGKGTWYEKHRRDYNISSLVFLKI
ncbi:hypothetical protein ADUPG1_000025 [Aduncisulcus paluster]|uniref:Uncharacterized protein n=1 Tax=Aduncisulcus paluster TaxID=2918883 RepID=A0ABQ5K4A2_9EUKA|nr:hypothetical protein ADUPG1_000025 [Aduncisulcus paluster]